MELFQWLSSYSRPVNSFLSPDQEYDLGGGRRLAVGTRVISATVEGAVGLPQGGEVETAFLELNVSSFDSLKRAAEKLRALINLKWFIHSQHVICIPEFYESHLWNTIYNFSFKYKTQRATILR